jgi:DNA-binding transcriptional ArsR family regulator
MKWKWISMPLDIENNTKTPLIKIKSSLAIELAAAIHYLSDRSHHSFSDKLANSLLNKLSIDSLKMLKLLSGMRLQGLELFEFIVKERAFDDIELLLLKISSYDDVSFIYTLLGEVLDQSVIQQVIENKLELEMLLKEKPNLTNCKLKDFELLFYQTKSFKADIVNLISEMNNSLLLNKLNSLNEDYSKHIEKTKIRLKDKSPMDVSQEIMERQFKRKFDFKEYYFIPAYFISPHKIRVFCTDAQMIVFSLEQRENPINEVGDKISLVFKIISDRTRLEILRAIISEPTYGKLLAEKLNLTTATISHHVEVLKSIQLITEKRIKNIKYFEANEDEIKKFFDEGLEYLFEK